jgi:hypothetical protein
VPWWIITCALGWAGFWLLRYMARSELANLGAGLLGAFGIGLLQWWVLRRYLRQAGWWIVVNVGTIGALDGIVWAFNWIVLHVFGGASTLFNVALFLPGMLFGGVTGYALVVLFQRADSNTEAASAQ